MGQQSPSPRRLSSTEDPFTETDWTDLTGDDVTAYVKSKTFAERAAWDFLASADGRGLDPVGIFGLVLSARNARLTTEPGSGSVDDREDLRQQDQQADDAVDDPVVDEHGDELTNSRARPEVGGRS